MNLPVFILAVAASCSFTAAQTTADLAPASLPGKTLEFTIEGSSMVMVPSSKWTAAFAAAPAKTVSINGFPGQTAASNPTWTYQGPAFGTGHSYELSSFPTATKPVELSIWISVGGIRFIVYVDGVDYFGGAKFVTTSAKKPEIEVKAKGGGLLVDGKSVISCGTVKLGKTGTKKTYLIKNTGTAALSGLALKPGGKHAKDFLVSKLPVTSLAPGKSASFNVQFKPKAKGNRSATLQVKSNDANESPFDIKLAGTGAP